MLFAGSQSPLWNQHNGVKIERSAWLLALEPMRSRPEADHLGRIDMTILSTKFDRRTVLRAAGAIGALQVASPFVIAARGDTPLKIGMVDPLTGVYAAPAQNEVTGARLAVDQINAKGGILGRPIALLVEDSA